MPTHLRESVACVLLSLLAGAALAEPRFSFDTTGGQLPKSVVPMDYTIAIEPDVQSGLINGTETIRLKVREASTRIQLNTLNEELSSVTLDGVPATKVESDNDRQVSTITLAAPAAVGEHTLRFAYVGKIEKGPQGLFLQRYRTPAGKEGQLLTTQFETAYARRMFPCWDEPAFRATFELTATIRADWTAVGNMPIADRTEHDGRATVHFERTPAMAAYLVEFTAGDLVAVSGRSGTTRLSVWAVRGQEQNAGTALANAQQILADYNRYFDYPFPLPKLDAIAIPGGFTPR